MKWNYLTQIKETQRKATLSYPSHLPEWHREKKESLGINFVKAVGK